MWPSGLGSEPQVIRTTTRAALISLKSTSRDHKRQRRFYRRRQELVCDKLAPLSSWLVALVQFRSYGSVEQHKLHRELQQKDESEVLAQRVQLPLPRLASSSV